MTLIVTGGAGFIGVNFILYLLKHYPQDKIICVDKLTYAGNLDALQGAVANPAFTFIKADITDAAAMEPIFEQEKPDIVINLAAETHVDRSVNQPDIFVKTNIVGTQVLLDLCRKYNVKRFHQASTDEVYGDLPLDNNGVAFTENSPLRASSPYSASKASADLLVLSYSRTYGLDITISRSSNNYGPFQNEEKLVPLTIKRALNDEPIPVYGNGLNMRDWLYVEDNCRAIDMIVRKGRAGEVYNIASHNEFSNIQLVSKILDKLGKPSSLIKFVEDRAGHDLRYSLDTSKAERELGFAPQITFEDGLTNTIKRAVLK